MERWSAKLLSLVLVLVFPLFFIILPHFISGLILNNGRQGERVLSYMLCFGGGIFLGTYLLHIAPEVRMLMDQYLLNPYGITYPVADLIVGCGFFFVLFTEKVVIRINKRRHRAVADSVDASETCSTTSIVPTSIQNDADDDTVQAELHDEVQRSDSSTELVGENKLKQSDDLTLKKGKESKVSGTRTNWPMNPESTTFEIQRSEVGKLESETRQNSQEYRRIAMADPKSDGTRVRNTAEIEVPVHAHSTEHGVSSLILIMALSLHHIFEGISLGLQSSLPKVFTLLGAIMCHEIIISFSLGMQLVRCSYQFRRVLVTAIVCSLFLPVGVAVGMAMIESTATEENEGKSSTYDRIQLANGILQAFAAGSFIFVTFFEILQKEIQEDDSSIWQVASAFLGFSLMSLVELIPAGMGKSFNNFTYVIVQNCTAN